MRCTMLHTLGLDHTANATDIKAAYLALVRRWHPDRVHADEQLRGQQGEKLSQINVAYSYLQRVPRPVPRSAAPNHNPSARDPNARTRRTNDVPNFHPAGTPEPRPFVIGRLVTGASATFIIISAAIGLIDKLRTPSPPPRRPAAVMASMQIPGADPGTAANVTGTFRGTTFNTTRHKGASTLLLVQQHGNQISGCFIVAPPMQGSGPITGQVRDHSVFFNANSPGNSMLFVGNLASDTISGSLVATHKNEPQQSGVFSFTRQPQAEEPIPDTCPKDQDHAVATGKLTMP
jgi:hypothetical protein